jgi:hypothetical protein
MSPKYTAEIVDSVGHCIIFKEQQNAHSNKC